MSPKIENWLRKYAEKVPCTIPGIESEIWVTKLRGDYITHVGMEDSLSYLCNLTYVMSTWEAGKPVNIGFNEEEQKWYGWSHRAGFSFGIGSTCKFGDVHYRAKDKDDFLASMVHFWQDEHHVNVRGEHKPHGVYVEWEYTQYTPNEKIRGGLGGNHHPYPREYGKGEWTAETLFDARQMAIDFANNIA